MGLFIIARLLRSRYVCLLHIITIFYVQRGVTNALGGRLLHLAVPVTVYVSLLFLE
jgi:hypothetical protein